MKSNRFALRLGIAFGVLIAILVGVDWLSLNRLARMNADVNGLIEKRWGKVQMAREALHYSTLNNRINMQIFLLDDREKMDALLAERTTNSGTISVLLKQIAADAEFTEEKALLTNIWSARTSYVESYKRALSLLLNEGRHEDARHMMVEITLPLMTAYHKAWEKFVDFQGRQMDGTGRQTKANFLAARRLVLTLGAVGVMIAMGIALFVTRNLTREIKLRHEVEHALREARDNLEARVIQRTNELTMMEVHLRQAQKLESVGQLAAGIAHEINTPIQYIGDNIRFIKESFTGLSALLENYGRLAAAAEANSITPELIAAVEASSRKIDIAYLRQEIPLAVKESLEGVGQVAHIVKAMKEFSHPGGKEKELINLNRAIETTITVARSEWKYVAELVTDLDPALPPVPCLPDEFNQVILNLIVNAAHAIGDVVKNTEGSKGKIKVSTRPNGPWAQIEISDTGTGIPERIRDRIFDPFFTTKGVGRGTGQGLAIARSTVVDKHGGHIEFESTVGQGTTFIIRLPMSAQKVAAR